MKLRDIPSSMTLETKKSSSGSVSREEDDEQFRGAQMRQGPRPSTQGRGEDSRTGQPQGFLTCWRTAGTGKIYILEKINIYIFHSMWLCIETHKLRQNTRYTLRTNTITVKVTFYSHISVIQRVIFQFFYIGWGLVFKFNFLTWEYKIMNKILRKQCCPQTLSEYN